MTQYIFTDLMRDFNDCMNLMATGKQIGEQHDETFTLTSVQPWPLPNYFSKRLLVDPWLSPF